MSWVKGVRGVGREKLDRRKMGMKLILTASFILLPMSLKAGDIASHPANWRGQPVTEFEPGENEAFEWRIVNDGVMGGLSKGVLKFTEDGVMKFSGMLSLENNGGFSSLRSGDVDLDLSNDLGLLLKVKGDGRTYQARLTTDETYRGMEMSFSAEFQTTKGKWTQIKVPFSAFKGSWRGRDLSDRRFDPSKIHRIGLLLGDKQSGPFELEVDYIRTYGKGQGAKVASK